MVGVPRSTVYGHLNKASGTRPVTRASGRAARLAQLPAGTRPLPTVDQYDQLLTGSLSEPQATDRYDKLLNQPPQPQSRTP